MDNEAIIRCFVDAETLIATFSTREGLEVEVLTPQERRLLNKGEFTQNDIERKFFELRQIGVAGND